MSYYTESLTKKYGDQIVLDNLSFEFDDNGIYLLRGQSGSGKTTLLRILAKLETFDTGTVKMPDKVSFCFQEHRLFDSLSALENVLIVSDKPDETGKEKAKALLLGLGFKETDINKTPSELSGGMKQRISFARSVFYDSDLLLLDEPTKELDDQNIDEILKIIKLESKHRLIIISTHDDLSALMPKAIINL